MKRETWLLGAGAALGACYFLHQHQVRRDRNFRYPGRVAVITGGVRGLGFVIARQLIEQGVRVAICSRTEQDVDHAIEKLRAMGGEVIGMVCDVRDRTQVREFMECVMATWNRIDLLFNVAGVMMVGPLDAMTVTDFYDAMEINCWGALHMTLEVLPVMRAQRWGRIVNVASIGGKQPIPHMLPYSASKHALVGLSNGMRIELAKDGILVTTACPTIMRTGSPRNAIFKGRRRIEYAWFDIGGSMPMISVSAERAAAQILKACQNGEGEVYVSNVLNPPAWAVRYAPNLLREAMSIIDGWMPGSDGSGEEAARGYESESRFAPSVLTRLGDAAAQTNNEMNAPNA